MSINQQNIKEFEAKFRQQFKWWYNPNENLGHTYYSFHEGKMSSRPMNTIYHPGYDQKLRVVQREDLLTMVPDLSLISAMGDGSDARLSVLWYDDNDNPAEIAEYHNIPYTLHIGIPICCLFDWNEELSEWRQLQLCYYLFENENDQALMKLACPWLI